MQHRWIRSWSTCALIALSVLFTWFTAAERAAWADVPLESPQGFNVDIALEGIEGSGLPEGGGKGVCLGASWCPSGPKGLCYAPDEPLSIKFCGNDPGEGFCDGLSFCTSGHRGVCYPPDHPLSIEHCGKPCGFCKGDSWCTCGPDSVCYGPKEPISIEHCSKECGVCDGESWCPCDPKGLCYAPDEPISIDHCSGHSCGFCDGASWCTCGPFGVCFSPDDPVSVEHCGTSFCEGGSLCNASSCLSPNDPRSLAVCACRLVDPKCAVGYCDGGSFCSSTCQVCYEPNGPISAVLCGSADIDRCCEVSAFSSTVTTGTNRTVALSGYTVIPGAAIDLQSFDLSSWTSVGTTVASLIPANPGGAELLYAWSKTVTIPLTDWPDGGVGRIRALANGSFGSAAALDDPACALGLALDSWSEVIKRCTRYASLPDQLAEPTLMLVDADPLPAAAMPFLSIKETTLSDSVDYYAGIGAGPGGPRETFDKWKCINGFENLANLACQNAGAPETTAYYFNNGDLGFGREMHCREVKGCEGADSCAGSGSSSQCGVTLRIACYVSNHDTADNAIAHSGELGGVPGGVQATVAMESIRVLPTPGFCASGLGTQPDDLVRFYVFGPSGSTPVLPAAALDSEGAKPAPGICLSCHQGEYDPGTHKVIGASFLPFDSCGFTYAADPAYSPTAQYERFRALNAMILDTDPAPGVVDLITGWYAPGDVHSPGAVANNGYVPSDWVDNDRQELYLEVVKPYCRTCHIAQTAPGKNFVSYSAGFEPRRAVIDSFACNAHIMPHAERALHNFWGSAARATLVSWLASEGVQTQCQ